MTTHLGAPQSTTCAGGDPLSTAQPALCGIGASSADGTRVTGDDGRGYLDLASGVGTLALGHGHPEVVAAASAQMASLCCTGGAVAHPLARTLAGRLAGIAPEGIDAFVFATTGAEANELALRLARRATRRSGVVAFSGGFHGRTAGAQAISSAVPGQGDDSGRQPDVEIAPFPVDADAVDEALAALDELHDERLPVEETACYVIEPVQGVGGCRPAPRRFLAALRERADRDGILLVVDEVQTGFCRTGAWFGVDALRVRPDVMVLGKAIGGGFPLSAVGARADLLAVMGPGDHGSTFGGHPVSCAAALATLEVMEREGLAARSARLGSEILALLSAELDDLPAVADVRGLGLMIGIEMRTPGLAERTQHALLDAGVLVLRSGSRREVIRLLPPLVVDREDLLVAVHVLCDVIRSLGAEEAPGATARPDAVPASDRVGSDRADPRRLARTACAARTAPGAGGGRRPLGDVTARSARPGSAARRLPGPSRPARERRGPARARDQPGGSASAAASIADGAPARLGPGRPRAIRCVGRSLSRLPPRGIGSAGRPTSGRGRG